MSKFQKLSQLNKDIELLENAGEIRAAEIMHKKFIKEAQYMMPQMMPQMMMPQMMPMMMPQMMARPMMPMAPAMAPRTVTPAAARPVATPAPVQQGQGGTTPPGTTPVNPPVNPPAPPTNKEIKPPYSGYVPPPSPQDNTQRGYGDKQSKDQELQYLQNELKRLQDQYGTDCGEFSAQCETLKQMISRNQGGAVIKG